MKYETTRAKSLLSKQMVADGWFHTNHSMNIYRGCEHGCVYCDGYCQYYKIDNFYTHIRIKENAPEVLRKELKRKGFTSRSELETETLWSFLDEDDAKRLAMKTPRKLVIGACGGVSDSYQQAEREYKITRRVLETLLDFQMPVMILTKSELVLRDLDILKEIHKTAFASVVFSITHSDESVQQIFEPKSSTTDERFAALKQVRRAGLYGGVMATPIIPWVGDSFEDMTELTKKAKSVNAEFIQYGGMTLKPGRQKDYFFNVVKKRMPEVHNNLKKAYSNNHRYGIPIWRQLPCNVMVRGHQISKKVGISDRSVRHQIPFCHELNYKVLGILLDIQFYNTYMFGAQWGENKPFHELAMKLERGVENLNYLRDEGILKERLQLDDGLLSIVEDIMDTDTSSYLSELLQKATPHGSGEQVFTASEDYESIAYSFNSPET